MPRHRFKASDRAEIHREAIDIASLVEEVGEVLRPQAEDKGLDLLMSVDATVMGTWNADARRGWKWISSLRGKCSRCWFRKQFPLFLGSPSTVFTGQRLNWGEISSR